jgi:AGCS family alanine or glycine:cation symporter
VLAIIFKDAFSLKCAVGGFCGYGIKSAIRYGVARGVISNEAGCGTAPCAHASSNSTSYHGQGCLGIFEVFVDTILLCTLTAIVVLLSKSDNSSPMELILFAFEKHTGTFGVKLITILCVFFAFATVICQFFYGIESVKFISKRRMVYLIYTVLFSVVTVVGAVIPMSLMWQISDLVIAIMTILNLICLFLLRKLI